jgi:hypothetical protein
MVWKKCDKVNCVIVGKSVKTLPTNVQFILQNNSCTIAINTWIGKLGPEKKAWKECRLNETNSSEYSWLHLQHYLENKL